jgi:hypothetical protein
MMVQKTGFTSGYCNGFCQEDVINKYGKSIGVARNYEKCGSAA